MKSCIYEGQVRHTRNKPAFHKFNYRLFMMYLDLDELPTLFRKTWFWSATRPALARFRRRDHLGPEQQELDGPHEGQDKAHQEADQRHDGQRVGPAVAKQRHKVGPAEARPAAQQFQQRFERLPDKGQHVHGGLPEGHRVRAHVGF